MIYQGLCCVFPSHVNPELTQVENLSFRPKTNQQDKKKHNQPTQ